MKKVLSVLSVVFMLAALADVAFAIYLGVIHELSFKTCIYVVAGVLSCLFYSVLCIEKAMRLDSR